MLLAVPVLCDQLATVFLGGPELSQQSLRLAFRNHYFIVGVGLVGLLVAPGIGLYGRLPTGESARE